MACPTRIIHLENWIALDVKPELFDLAQSTVPIQLVLVELEMIERSLVSYSE